MIKDKRILITGCAGSIGSELTRQLSKNNKVFGIDINESGLFDIQQETKCFGRVGDIKDKNTVFDIFSDFKPQLIFHAAAYKHVPLMEKYPIEAIQTNILGTWNVISEAKRWECLEKFVFISSDKAVHANSIMGATKRMGEVMVKNQGKEFCVVRFGNVLGSRGSLITIWEKQINEGKPITITDEKMFRYFMTIEEACELVIKASIISKGGEIFILDMGKKIKILDLAKELIKNIGENIPIKIIGKREGEVLEEKLMFSEEEARAIKKDKFFIIK
jgi:FlaA1/EpsC-like NDP-sugar epimerase